MDDVTDKELAELIATCTFRDNERLPRERVALALIELRDLRRRWRTLTLCFPWAERWLTRLSRKPRLQSG